MEKKLYRDELHKKVGGVCAGLADYLGMDVSIVRVIFVLSLVIHGVGLVPYIVLWAVLPKKPYFGNQPFADYTVPPSDPFNPFKNSAQPNFGTPNPGSFGEQYVPAKKPTNIGVICGAILIILGTAFLLNNLDLIPDIDANIVFPSILVAIGAIFIFSGSKKQPWDKKDAFTQPETEAKPEETTTNDNPTTI